MRARDVKAVSPPISPATALQKLRQFNALRFGVRVREFADDRVPKMRRKENCASSSDDLIEQVSLKRKASIGLAALFVCFFMVIEGTRERYDERPKRATFLGFTNTGPDQVNAIIRFPSVHPRAPGSTFFYKPIYDIDFEIEYIHSAGRRTTQRLGDRLYFSAGLPVGEADLLAPVPHDAVAMTLLKAEGVLASRPDNELFGWRLRPPKERKWKFQMEAISIGVTNAPATSDF